MKKLLLVIFYFSSVFSATAKKIQMANLIGFRVGAVAPINPRNYGIPKYKMGLPVFSYATSIESRFTINYRLNFSLQYSLTYLQTIKRGLQPKMAPIEEKPDVEKGKENQISSGISFISNYKLNKTLGVVAGFGLEKPLCFDNISSEAKKIKMLDYPLKCTDRFSPSLSPFLMIGFENSCNIFRKNLIYSIQYNLGFMPGRSLPISVQSPQNDNQYSHGIQIGLKYKY